LFDVRLAPNSGTKADIDFGPVCANRRLMHRSNVHGRVLAWLRLADREEATSRAADGSGRACLADHERRTAKRRVLTSNLTSNNWDAEF
jgi:hypothetical protein